MDKHRWRIDCDNQSCIYKCRPFIFVIFSNDKTRCWYHGNKNYNFWTYPKCDINLCPIKLSD